MAIPHYYYALTPGLRIRVFWLDPVLEEVRIRFLQIVQSGSKYVHQLSKLFCLICGTKLITKKK